jgi:hypothetical protein
MAEARRDGKYTRRFLAREVEADGVGKKQSVPMRLIREADG